MKLLLLTLFILVSFLGVAQEKQICAYIVDSKSGEPLMAAEVRPNLDFNNRFSSTFSDDNGFFCIDIDSGVAELQIILLGTSDTVVSVGSLSGDTIKLIQRPSELGEIKIYKPAIYLYPTQKTTVHIQHDFKGEIGTTYPAYKNGWQIVAEPNGTLLNLADNRKYEYLFWDGTYTFPATHFDYKEGFVVAKENTTDFLWKQLAFIGLNEKEINDFVVYWLPQLERNDHNFIHFHINNDIDHSSILTVQPQPDSWIRLFMEFKSVPANYFIAEQKLPTIKRDGFTLVEWGGAVIENSETNFE